MSDIERVALLYDSLADKYDGIYQNKINFEENKIVFNLVKQYTGESILDIGCGTGLLLDYLSPSKYVGLDLSYNMTSRAREKHSKRDFLVGQMHNLPVENEAFDTVLSLFSVFNFTITPEIPPNEVLRVLKPGGYFIGTVAGLRMKYGILTGPLDFDWKKEGIPVTYYTQNLIKEVFSGFDDLQILGLNYFGNLFEGNSSYVIDESRLLGKTIPDLARHIIIIGRKPI